MTQPLPNFFLIGASRSGTTFLHACLRRQRSVYLPRKPQELWCLNVDSRFAKYQDYYTRTMRHHGGQPLIGDVTPTYLHHRLVYRTPSRDDVYVASNGEDAVARLARYFPSAKVIVTLRHPLARFRSMYQKNYLQGKSDLPDDINRKAMEDLMSGERIRNFVYLNRYKIHLEPLAEAIDRERLKILIFEEWTSDPEGVQREILRFLEAPETDRIELPRSKNRAEQYYKRLSAVEFIKMLRHPARVLQRRYWSGWSRTLRVQRTGSSCFDMRNSTLKRLKDVFDEDVEWVQAFLGRPIDAWIS